MAKMWGWQGAIWRLVRTDEEEAQFGPPEQFDDVLEFDPDTNAELLNGLDVDWNAHRVENGILYRNNSPVVINSPGTVYLDKQIAQAFWNDLGNGIDWLEARQTEWQNQSDAWDGLTDTQKNNQLRDNFGTILGHLATLAYVNYRVLRFIRWLIKAILRPVWAQ